VPLPVIDGVAHAFQRHLDAAARVGDVLVYSEIRVRIDRPVGFVQTGIGPDGPWSRTYSVPYGEIEGTAGGDGEALDVFCGPDHDAPLVFWAEQRRLDGSFDEYKLGLGWPDEASFTAAYLAHIPADRLGRIGGQPIAQMQALLGLDPRARAEALAVLREKGPAHLLDLGQGAVHVTGPVKVVRSCVNCGSAKGWNRNATRTCAACGSPFFAPAPHTSSDSRGTMAKNVSMISAAKRKSLPADKFALPAQKKYPIDTKLRVRNAAARLEQAKKRGDVSAADYKIARGAIAKAAKHFGIGSEYLETDKPRPASPLGRRPGVHVRVTSPSGHHVEITHAASDGGRICFGDAMPIALDPGVTTAKGQRLLELEGQLAALDPAAETWPVESTRLREEVTRLRAELDAPVWNQLARCGTFRGHPAGPFELTPAIFDEIVANFMATENRRIPIDFEHASETDATSGSIPTGGAPATGWILQLDNRGLAGLWGLVQWLEPARTYIREGKYRFFSPAIRFGAKDRVTGKPIGARMTSGALTNIPFLDGLMPLAATDHPTPGVKKMSTANPADMLKSLKACLKLPELATHKMMKDHLDMLREHVKVAGIGSAPHGHAMGVHAGDVHLGDYVCPMGEAMGCSADTTTDQVLDAVESMIDAAMDRHVAEYHPMSDPQPTDPGAMGVALGEAKAQLIAKTGELRTVLGRENSLKTMNAAMALQLNERDATIAGLRLELQTKEGELRSLRDAEVTRAEQAIAARVAEAFDTYKDVRALSEDHRRMMLLTAKTDPPLFETIYPVVPPAQRHLLRNITDGRMPTPGTAPHLMGGAPGAPNAPLPVGAPARSPGQPVLTPVQMKGLATRLMSERNMDASSANSLAYKVAMGAAPSPFAN